MKVESLAKHEGKQFGWSFWLTIIGGIILFAAWVAQNHYKAKWDGEIQKLQRSQLVIDIEEVNRSVWEQAYLVESQRKPINKFLLAKAELELTRAYLDLYTWSVARVSDNSVNNSKMMEVKHMIDTTARQDLREGNYQHISQAFYFVSGQFGKYYMNLDRSFSAKVDEVSRIQENWQKVFMGSYIVGSIMLGWAFILERLSKNKA